tara:strand:- start:1134 stop:1823 length:690 start_codon:yes stop_codon:yes gene_type:complete
MALGGSTSSTVSVPKYIEDAAKANLAKADLLAQIGPTRYYGPDVAAFSPMQALSFGNTAKMSGAFGLGGGTGMEGVPTPTQFAGGISGYSAAPLFEQFMAELELRNPGQYAAINAPFIDPITGAAPDYPYTGSTGINPNNPEELIPGSGMGQSSGGNDSGGSGGVFFASNNPNHVSYTGNTPGQMSNASYTQPMFSGGGADNQGNFGALGDYLGGIGDAIGITNYGLLK